MKFSRCYEFTDNHNDDHDCGRGLLTLGEPKMIQLESNKTIELLPYVLEWGITRFTNLNDIRRRRCASNAFPLLAEAYTNHYNNAEIGEQWTKEQVIDMMQWHFEQSQGRFFFVKWAREKDSEREFPVGFVSAYSKPFQRGKTLWDGEIFVLPEYQKYGIGTELVTVLLTVAKASGIRFFESLTYEDENGYPLELWKKYGVKPSDLIHVSAEIDIMLSRINNVVEGRITESPDKGLSNKI